MSAVRSEPLHDDKAPARQGIDWNKVAAIVAWAGGAFTTYLFFARAMPSVGWLVSGVLAGCTQWLLTIAERPLWRVLLRRKGGRFVLLGIVVTLVDGLLNAGGLYPYMSRLEQTDVGKMVSDVLHVQQAMTPTSAFLLALAIGLVIAGLPEYLWEAGERR
jgi:hypothetical protein